MEKTNETRFSASGSMLGYLYQCRLALLTALERIKANPNLEISVETLDDVQFEENGAPLELLQAKHHINPADLTDYSVDLWKTIRIWSELKKNSKFSSDVTLCLITTAQAKKDTIAARLRTGESRDEKKALASLKQIALSSDNQTTLAGRDAFSSLSENEKKELIEAIVVFDKYSSISGLDQSLEEALWGVCERAKVSCLLEHLEGWWHRKVIECLQQKCKVSAQEIESCIGLLRESFKDNNLPIADEVRNANPDVAPFKDWIFSKQLRLIGVGEKRVGIAAKNFYKAREQRSRWIREELLIENDLDSYDEHLEEEWSVRFEQAVDHLPNEVTEEENVKAGQGIYKWVETDASIPIKPQCQEAFITRGSYQILSNRKKVGWHPEFKDLLDDSNEGEA